MQLIEATAKHIPVIQSIADVAWPHTFRELLSPEQIKYMMDMMYSTDALCEQINRLNHNYLIVEDDGKHIAYTAYEIGYDNQPQTKIHKIYILPTAQKKGIGKLLIEAVAEKAKKVGQDRVLLNVNKHNANAISFYQHVGFEIIRSEENEIGDGYIMDDYVLSLPIR